MASISTISLSVFRQEPRVKRVSDLRLDPRVTGIVRSAIEQLRPQHRDIIKLRFGFATGQEETYDSIGARLGVTRSAVYQQAQTALRRLRQQLASLAKTPDQGPQ